MNHDRHAVNRGAVRPMQCLADGWRLIKEEYWFFLGIAFVGELISQLAPLFLMGPAYFGIHICLLHRANGQRVTFDMLFQGFNYFAPSLLASFLMMLPMIVIVIIYYAALAGGGIGLAIWAGQNPQGGGQDAVWLMFAWIA